MKKNLILLGQTASWLLVLLVLFTCGVLMERHGLLPGAQRRPPTALARQLEPFWETWHLVQTHYVDRDAVEPNCLVRGAIKGLLATLADVGHNHHLTPDEHSRFEGDLKRAQEATAPWSLRQQGNNVVFCGDVSTGFPDGLRAGDVLHAVDEHAIRGMSIKQIDRQIRLGSGEFARLEIGRDRERHHIETLRSAIEVPTVECQIVPGTAIAHVAVREFNARTHPLLRKALEEARRQGASGVVLDLRGNGGGVVDHCASVVGVFIQDGEVFHKEDARGKRMRIRVPSGESAFTDIPLSVLIDGQTASSAEIVAAALQENGRAILVGQRTCGTGTIMRRIELSDGSVLMLSFFRWLTPQGRYLRGLGVTPDVVANPVDSDQDGQLAQAVAVLQYRIDTRVAQRSDPVDRK